MRLWWNKPGNGTRGRKREVRSEKGRACAAESGLVAGARMELG